MNIFAKLYERDGEQVLVTKDEMDDDGSPCVRVTFRVPVGTASADFAYKSEEDRDRGFALIGEEEAFAARSALLERSSAPMKKLLGVSA